MTTDAPDSAADTVRLVSVCTGNTCSSPYAAAVLQNGLDWARPGAFSVTSAGTHALVGRPMDEESRGLLERKGIRSTGFSARLLSDRTLQTQALILVMGSRHREMVLQECPSVQRRVLGILDLATALEGVAQEYSWVDLLADAGAKEVGARWRALPEMLRALGALPDAVDEVADPDGRGTAAFTAMSEQLDTAVRSIVLWEAQFPR